MPAENTNHLVGRSRSRFGASGGLKLILASISILITAAGTFSAQVPDRAVLKRKAATSGELFETIARMDRVVFEAFNAHDVERLMSMFTKDLEFYDDGDGFNDYEKTTNDFRELFRNTPDIRRELIKESLEVYPLQGYGAIEAGEHRFCHRENGNDDCGVFKFAMVWRKSGEVWKLSRVLSYAH